MVWSLWSWVYSAFRFCACASPNLQTIQQSLYPKVSCRFYRSVVSMSSSDGFQMSSFVPKGPRTRRRRPRTPRNRRPHEFASSSLFWSSSQRWEIGWGHMVEKGMYSRRYRKVPLFRKMLSCPSPSRTWTWKTCKSVWSRVAKLKSSWR